MGYFDNLSIVSVSYYHAISDSVIYTAVHNRIGLMTGGTVTRERNGVIEQLTCPFIYMISRGTKMQWRVNPGETRNSFRFDFSGPRAEALILNLLEDFPEGYFPAKNLTVFQTLLEDMSSNTLRRKQVHNYHLAFLVEQFTDHIYEARFTAYNTCKYKNLLQSTADEIFREPSKTHDFAALAKKLKLTPNHFRKLFRSQIGHPPYEYLMQCRFALAQRLLNSDENLYIQEISHRCGFGNPTEFTRFFKKYAHCPPSQYLKKRHE